MTNLDWLNNMKLFDDERGILKDVKIANDLLNNLVGISVERRDDYRKIKALEIIAEELILAVRELKTLVKAVRGKI